MCSFITLLAMDYLTTIRFSMEIKLLVVISSSPYLPFGKSSRSCSSHEFWMKRKEECYHHSPPLYATSVRYLSHVLYEGGICAGQSFQEKECLIVSFKVVRRNRELLFISLSCLAVEQVYLYSFLTLFLHFSR